ncbi:hypothetical protein Lnau_3122 [Legionella nautarum]|uniref:Uncharacterized protein n=1 Tax=Legionella nautarum TaxID=45070 RepID=A0A0W0WIY8_9GAMM|nr:hypothetical protein Lnau_3122 [Legionella nautarum]
MIKTLCSAPFVIAITIILLFVFYLTGLESNPQDILATAFKPLLVGFMGLFSLQCSYIGPLHFSSIDCKTEFVLSSYSLGLAQT